MREWIRNWLDARRRRAERDAFARGYEWGCSALDRGTFSVEALEAFAGSSVFNKHPCEYAFDRGVNAAVADQRTRHA
jgi:hypothetical protein